MNTENLKVSDFVIINGTEFASYQEEDQYVVAHKEALRVLAGRDEVPEGKELKCVDKGMREDASGRTRRKFVLALYTEQHHVDDVWLGD